VDGGIACWRWLDGSEWRIDGGDAKQHKRSGSKTGPAGTTSSSNQDSRPIEADGGGWIYYDNKWNEGRREDGWGRYTRRRKWYRDAELVEINPSTAASPVPTTTNSEDESEKIRRAQQYAKTLSSNHGRNQSGNDMADSVATLRPSTPPPPSNQVADSSSPALSKEGDDTASIKGAKKKITGWFSKRNRSDSKSSSGKNTAQSTTSEKSTYSRDGPHDDVYDRWRDSGGGAQGRMNIAEDAVVGLG